MLTAPDGDRDLTIWTWLCACRATSCHCPRPGSWRSPAARSCRATARGWAVRRRPAPRPCRSTSSISRRPRVVAYRPPPSVDRPSITSKLSAGGRIAVAPGDVAEGAHLRALRRQHLPDHPAAGRRSRHAAGHRRRHDQDALCRDRWRSPASTSARSSSASSSQLGRARRRIPQVIVEFVCRPHPYGDGVGRREEPRTRVDSRRDVARSSTPSTGPAGRSTCHGRPQASSKSSCGARARSS